MKASILVRSIKLYIKLAPLVFGMVFLPTFSAADTGVDIGRDTDNTQSVALADVNGDQYPDLQLYTVIIA